MSRLVSSRDLNNKVSQNDAMHTTSYGRREEETHAARTRIKPIKTSPFSHYQQLPQAHMRRTTITEGLWGAPDKWRWVEFLAGPERGEKGRVFGPSRFLAQVEHCETTTQNLLYHIFLHQPWDDARGRSRSPEMLHVETTSWKKKREKKIVWVQDHKLVSSLRCQYRRVHQTHRFARSVCNTVVHKQADFGVLVHWASAKLIPMPCNSFLYYRANRSFFGSVTKKTIPIFQKWIFI